MCLMAAISRKRKRARKRKVRKKLKIYLIGSLKNQKVRALANKLRKLGFEVFDDWQAAHPEADDNWRDYEKGRGRTYREALKGHAAKNIYDFDKTHLDDSDIAILCCPAGKSGHLELGYFIGLGRPGYILLDDPERWDVMYQFAAAVFEKEGELESQLKKDMRRFTRHGGQARAA